jgi:hypothetical protein
MLMRLSRGELRYGNDQVAALCGLTCLLGETRAELRRRVVASDREKIVERRDGPTGWGVHSLVKRVENISGRSAAQNSAGNVVGQAILERA